MTTIGGHYQFGQGRSTAINFSQANERITYVLLTDPSRVVYATNAPIESGQERIDVCH